MPDPKPIRRLLPRRHGGCCWYLLATLVAATIPGHAAEPTAKQVLLLHSFGRDFAPFNTVSETFRTELGQRLGERLEFHDVALESARFPGEAAEQPLVNYLSALFLEGSPDLIVTIGGPAARFAQKYRQQLFPAKPLLLAGTDYRHLQSTPLGTNDTAVAVANDLPRVMESLLQAAPETTNVAVVVGSSPLEKFWLAEMQQVFQQFTNRVRLDWFSHLSFAEMQKRAASLPPRSAIFYALLSVDAEGVPYASEAALRRLHAVANAPIFGIHDSQLGLGIVGGPLMNIEEMGRKSAALAVRLLQGEDPAAIRTPPQPPGRPIYDWRELQRWNISEARLPAGSVVRFRQPSLWQLYHWPILGGISFCLLEAGLIVLLVTNLVNRRRAERTVQESQERLSLVLEANSEGVWDWNIPSGKAYFSPQYCAMLGYMPAEFARDYNAWKALVHPDDFDRVHAEHVAHLQQGKRFDVELRMRKKSGDWCWIRSRGTLVERDHHGNPVRMVGTHLDITERKRDEQEMQRQREELAHVSRVSVVGELSASVAHELNQPLGAILSNAEAAEMFLAQDPPALEEVRAILADIRSDDERASEVIRRMRALLRKGELEREPLQLGVLVEEVFHLVAANAALRSTHLRAELTPGLPLVQGDRVQLQQVLLNLIMNGLEAMAKQSIDNRRLTVRTGLSGDGQVEVSVADSGPGIDAQSLPRVFEPFFTTKPNGIGMGLAICRKILEAHHGRIWGENAPGGGAVFRFSLPAAENGAE